MTDQERLLRLVQLLAVGVVLFIGLSWAQANVSGLRGAQNITQPTTPDQWLLLGIYWLTLCLPFALVVGGVAIVIRFVKK